MRSTFGIRRSAFGFCGRSQDVGSFSVRAEAHFWTLWLNENPSDRWCPICRESSHEVGTKRVKRDALLTANALAFLETEFPRTDKEENDHDAEHFNGARILLEIMRVPSKGRNEGDEHRQCDQGGGWSEKETDNDQDSTGKLGQGSD
jgi:hypothetical protein